jgi:hypothetical protein
MIRLSFGIEHLRTHQIRQKNYLPAAMLSIRFSTWGDRFITHFPPHRVIAWVTWRAADTARLFFWVYGEMP